MGLDIYVGKVKKYDKKSEYKMNLVECPELNVFKRYSKIERVSYFNFTKIKKIIKEKFNIDFDVNKDWRSMHFSNIKEIRKVKDKRFYKYDFTPNAKRKDNYDHIMEFENDKFRLILIGRLPVNYRFEPHICYEEVGYQRKGANQQFYIDKCWDGPCIITRKDLLKYWNKYFSGEDNTKKENVDDYGYGVEYDNTDKVETRKNFKNNIIKNFVEGKTFVKFS